jgi:hypothetical protein
LSPNSRNDRRQPSDKEADEVVDRRILRHDTSQAGWQRRAVGVPHEEALAQLPKARQMTTSIRIDAWRAIRAHYQAQQLTAGEWVRRAIINQYIREGGDRKVARDADITRRIHR